MRRSIGETNSDGRKQSSARLDSRGRPSAHEHLRKLRPDQRGLRFDDVERIVYDRSAGWSSLVARWAHNPKVGGSNPPPATNFFNQLQPFGPERSAHFSLILPAIARQPARARPVFGHSRLGCKRSLSWRCWNAARVPAAPSHRCGSHVAGKNTSAGTCASPQS